MNGFISLNNLKNDIENFIQEFGYEAQSITSGKIAIYPPLPSHVSFDYKTHCHISIFETSLLFPGRSNRTVFIVSLDNCSCLRDLPNINCHTIGSNNQNGQIGANGLIIDIILSDNENCRYRVLYEIINAIIKALDILRYFKGNNWDCHNC